MDRENAPVRIIGRRAWLTDEEFRNRQPWEGAAWVEEFDRRVKKMAEDDECRPLDERRVIIAGEERGKIDGPALLEQEGGGSLRRRVSTLMREGKLPPGMVQKAARPRARGKAWVPVVLRDVINHQNAVSEANAVAAATPWEHMNLVLNLIPEASPNAPPSGSTISAAEMRSALRLLRHVRPIVSAKRLQSFLSSRDMREDLLELLYGGPSDRPIALHLSAEIRQFLVRIARGETLRQTLRSVLLRPDPVEQTLNFAGLVLLLLGLLLEGPLGFAWFRFAWCLARPKLERSSLVPIRDADRRLNSLFYLWCGTERVTIRQIRDLLAKIELLI